MVNSKIGLIGLLASMRVTAQNTTTASIASVFLPNAEQFAYGVMGSIVTAQPDKTAIVLACPPKSNTDFCQYMIGDTVTYGPTTFSYNALLKYNRACSFDTQADVAYCTIDDPSVESYSHYTMMQSTFAQLRTPVTITAGFDKLQPSPGSSYDSSAVSATTSYGAPTSIPIATPGN